LTALEGAGADTLGLPAVERLAERVRPIAAQVRWKKKTDVSLDRSELDRQLNLARWFCERRDLMKALLVLREWLVNVMLDALGASDGWLDRQKRQRAERLLHAANARRRAGLATAEEGRLGALWESVADLRNALGHAGMRPETSKASPDKVKDLIARCESLLTERIALPPKLGSSGRKVLVTPLGRSKGVIYSAVLSEKPDSMVVVTSAEARPGLEEALAGAGMPALPTIVRELAEPYHGFGEVNSLLDSEVTAALADASEVVVNLTGGTTAIQWAVEAFGRRAARLGVAVRRIALVDRRSPQEQQAEPFVLGERVELTAEPGEVAD
jgi:hypothetical protein